MVGVVVFDLLVVVDVVVQIMFDMLLVLLWFICVYFQYSQDVVLLGLDELFDVLVKVVIDICYGVVECWVVYCIILDMVWVVCDLIILIDVVVVLNGCLYVLVICFVVVKGDDEDVVWCCGIVDLLCDDIVLECEIGKDGCGVLMILFGMLI